jgi:hypothetical protein
MANITINSNSKENPLFRFVVNKSPIPQPLVTLVVTSDSGTATLIGFSEFTSPSIPPRKYRRRVHSGQRKLGIYVLSSGCTPPNLYGYNWVIYDLVCQYDPITGVLNTNNQTSRSYFYPSPFTTQPYSDDRTVCSAATSTLFSPVVDQISAVETGYEFSTCTDFGWLIVGSTYGSTRSDTSVPVPRFDLSDEDLPVDAMIRATRTPGSSNKARTEGRLAADFVFDFVLVYPVFQLSNLVIGQSYRVSYELNTEDYGGGNSVVTQHTHDFVASGTTQNINYPIDSGRLVAPNAKDVTIQNATVIHLP